jgi:hypothetical protein
MWCHCLQDAIIGYLFHHLLIILQAGLHCDSTNSEASRNRQHLFENIQLEFGVCGLNPTRLCRDWFEKERSLKKRLTNVFTNKYHDFFPNLVPMIFTMGQFHLNIFLNLMNCSTCRCNAFKR